MRLLPLKHKQSSRNVACLLEQISGSIAGVVGTAAVVGGGAVVGGSGRGGSAGHE